MRRLPVRELYLQHNSLKKLPETLGSMSALEVLDVSNNALTDLPESVGALDSLRVLRARDNRLSRLPRCALSPHSTVCTTLSRCVLRTSTCEEPSKSVK